MDVLSEGASLFECAIIKACRRDRIVIFATPGIHNARRQREEFIKHTLEPIICLDSGKVINFKMLMRHNKNNEVFVFVDKYEDACDDLKQYLNEKSDLFGKITIAYTKKSESTIHDEK